MKPPADFVVPPSVGFWAYTYNSIVHVTEKCDVKFIELEKLPANKTLVCFDLDSEIRYTRECVLLQVIQDKDILQKVAKRWAENPAINILVHLKYKWAGVSNGKERLYKFNDINNRPVRLSVPVETLTLNRLDRLARMNKEHCYVIELFYEYGEIHSAKVLVNTTTATRIGKPSWLQK